jgi:transposase-like protein
LKPPSKAAIGERQLSAKSGHSGLLANEEIGLLAFYDSPAAHWMHPRTTNPIESMFAPVHLRTAKTRGCVSRTSILSMVFKLVRSVEKRWRAWIETDCQGYHRRSI